MSEVWVPVPLRWRHVNPGDVFLSEASCPDDAGTIWMVTRMEKDWGGKVTCQSGPDVFSSEVDPDDVVDVLVPVSERDAVELSMDELGARLIARRNED